MQQSVMKRSKLALPLTGGQEAHGKGVMVAKSIPGAWLAAFLLAATGLALPPGTIMRQAAAQIAPATLAAGRQQVTDFMGRLVRVTGRETAARPGQTGYGFIIGGQATPQGGMRLLIATADHLVRDPASPQKPPAATLTFYGNLPLSFNAHA